METVRRFGAWLAQKVFSYLVWQSASLIWLSCMGAFLLLASPPLMAIIHIKANPIIQHHAIIVTAAEFAGAIVLTVFARLFASDTIPSMDRVPTLKEAYEALKPPIWAKPLVWLSVTAVTFLARRGFLAQRGALQQQAW
jgi:hypothetical protein